MEGIPPSTPTGNRARRTGAWVSALGHAGVIVWIAVGGALFRGQPAAPIRMTNVQTMSDAEFQQMAAATRGSGPVGAQATTVPAQPKPPSDEVVAGGNVSVAPPAPVVDPLAMPAPEVAPEAAPDLSDLRAPQTAIAVATIAPVLPDTPVEASGTANLPDAAPGRAIAMAQPQRPTAPGADAPAAEPADPEPPGLAPLTSTVPLDANAARARAAERQAAALAAAEAQRQAAAEAEAQRQAAAEAQRQAAAAAREQAARDRAAADAAAREQAAAAAAQAAAAEQAARAEAEARAREQAEVERQAALAAAAEERRLAEENAAAEAARLAQEESDRREAEAAAARRQARIEADRRAVEEAAREEAEAQRREEERLAAEAAAAEQARAAEAAARAEAEAKAREQAEVERAAPDDALTAALEQAMNFDDTPEGANAEGGGGRAETGPPLTSGERDGLRLAIQECWNSGALSREAAQLSISVGFSMSPDGMPRENSVKLLDADGGSDQAASQAFDVARRAILRCGIQQDGYDLPRDKYGRWKDVIVDFSAGGRGVSMR